MRKLFAAIICLGLITPAHAQTQNEDEREPEGGANVVWPENMPSADHLRYPKFSSKSDHEQLRTILRQSMPSPLALPATAQPIPKYQTENMRAMMGTFGAGMPMIPAWMAYGAAYCSRSLMGDYYQSPYWDCLQRGTAIAHREDGKLVFNFYPRGEITPQIEAVTGPLADGRSCPASAKAHEFFVRCSFYDQHHLMTLHRTDDAANEHSVPLTSISRDQARSEDLMLPPVSTAGDRMTEYELIKLFRKALPNNLTALSVRHMLALEACTLPDNPHRKDDMSAGFYLMWFLDSEEPDQNGVTRKFINVIYAPQAIPTSLMPDVQRIEYEKRGIDRLLQSIPHYRCMVDAETFERVWVKPSDEPYTFFMLEGHNMNFKELPEDKGSKDTGP